MVAYGFARGHVDTDLALALRMGASVLEILPDWRRYPDPAELCTRVADLGLRVHSAHGCWGGQSIRADRVDLGQIDPEERARSVDDLRRCVDWLAAAGGACLVVHPGGLSDPEQTAERTAALAHGLSALADHARGTGVVVCVENMPPGVHPGSRMADVAAVIAELGRPELALALDTGHAHLTSSPAEETIAAGTLLRTTHVHDNRAQADSHDPPGHGTIDWDAWRQALDRVAYSGPIMLECIRFIRERPDCLDTAFHQLMVRLTRGPSESA
jgi:sugar phosphate isomerase/epimerase